MRRNCSMVPVAKVKSGTEPLGIVEHPGQELLRDRLETERRPRVPPGATMYMAI